VFKGIDWMRVGIVGGSGFVGAELLRLLLNHPEAEIAAVVSRQKAGEYLFRTHPNLRGVTDLKFVPLDIAHLTKECELVFTALPHGSSAKLVPDLLKQGVSVIDLGADFRLRNPDAYPTWYGWEHPHPELLEDAVYGLPELHRDEIKKAHLVACPGCMATAAILALYPVIKDEAIQKNRIAVDVKIGSSGAGAKPTLASVHAERFGGVRPYRVIGHRHIAEIEQEFEAAASTATKVGFSPHAVNIVRGILATVHCFLTKPIVDQDIWRAYRSKYQNEPFIRLVRDRKSLYQLPDPKVVLGSNFCDIGFEVDTHADRLVLFSAIDNLMKGASGQAVQCFNIMLDTDERTALESSGFHPM
jgi:N-acetyl-gamma-glutamyl-phosphate/LysW-gamma-L-alpha-aminoadipyl-6-phosphate reductase